MIKIKMLSTQNILTKVGPREFQGGHEYEAEDWIAGSFLGRGLAELVEEVDKQTPDIEGKTVAELRVLAEQKGIIGYNGMKKKELQEALGSLLPPDAPFEQISLSGGKTPPEFKRD